MGRSQNDQAKVRLKPLILQHRAWYLRLVVESSGLHRDWVALPFLPCCLGHTQPRSQGNSILCLQPSSGDIPWYLSCWGFHYNSGFIFTASQNGLSGACPKEPNPSAHCLASAALWKHGTVIYDILNFTAFMHTKPVPCG